LFLLCLAWLLPGLTGHAPWKGGDAEHFAAFIGGEWSPPLYFWTAQLTALLTADWLPLHDGIRLASGLFVAIALFFTARTARALYGADHTWAAALALLGSVGLLVRGHEMNLYTAQLAGAALALYGMARLPDGARGAAGLALGLLTMLFAGGAAEPLLFALIAVCLPLLLPAYRVPRAALALTLGLAVALALALTGLSIVPRGDLAATLAFTRWQGVSSDPWYFISIYGWYAWPVWPLALWALWRARRQPRAPGVILPVLTLLGLFALYARLAAPGEDQALILLLPAILLGAAGLMQLRRGAANALLWFGVTSMSLLGLFFWVYWSAHDLGVPTRLANRLLRLGVPEIGHFRPWAALLGALVTAAWIALLWRLKRSPLRPMLVWSAGVTFVWCLLFALFLQPLDARLNYRGVAFAVAMQVPAGACVDAVDTQPLQRRLLAYHGARALTLSPGCDWKLVQTRRRDPPPVPADWTLRWQGNRPGERREFFVLYARVR
jgi:hypothetical protein